MLNKLKHESNAEEFMVFILKSIHTHGPIDANYIEVLTYIKIFYKNIFKKYEKRLLYLMGMFYKVSEPNGLIEEIYEMYSQAIYAEMGARYTPMQSEAYRYINKMKYFSFSAPTSAGKSFLFREIIKDTIGDIVIVVPSRALIAEYMSSVLELVDKSVLVLQFIENVNIEKIKKRIYIITPERGVDLFSKIDELNIQLFLLDEAQISEEEKRGISFDSFVRRIDKYLPYAKKVFAHPFIDNPEAQLFKHNFIKESKSRLYMQYTVGRIFLTQDNGTFTYFSPYNDEWTQQKIALDYDLLINTLNNNGTALIYISKSKIISGEYIESFSKYIDACPKIEDTRAISLIELLKEYIGANNGNKYSVMIHMMEKGIVIHHGSIPLKARLIIEEFVRNGFAKICFATSTLNQGINMPFDIVWIDNFYMMEPLTIKNLIGRAGRSTLTKDKFDFGYVIINAVNRNTFTTRLNETITISETSALDKDLRHVSIDDKDIIEAMKEDTFDDELKLTQSQVERLDTKELDSYLELILDSLLINDQPLGAKQYYDLGNSKRSKIKDAFKKIYIHHLRKESLTKAETSILSASIPILLWHIQGKSFSEVVSLRYAFLSEKDKRREIRKRVAKGQITARQAEKEMRSISPKFSCKAGIIPNSNAVVVNLFQNTPSILDIDYDTLVYDTYDFLDKVISLSITNPLCGAFRLYSLRSGNEKADIIANYIRYGTNNDTEIWLLKYGFAYEDIEWIVNYVDDIGPMKINFKSEIKELEPKKLKVIERFI